MKRFISALASVHTTSTRRGSAATNTGMALCLAAGVACVSATTPHARGDALWRQTKRYTAQVVGAYEQALDVLEKAKDALEEAAKNLKHLKQLLQAAGGAIANPQLAARVAQAAAAVTAAEGAVTAAAEAAAVAAAAAAAFMGGTCIGQGGNYLISWCWDPICEFDGAAFYQFPTDTQIDPMIEQMILQGTGVTITKADFDAAEAAMPGTGAVSWQYLRESVRTYSIAARGIGAYTQRNYNQVLDASQDLDDQFERFSLAAEDFAAHLSGVQTYTVDPRAELVNAIAEAQGLLPDVAQFPDPIATQAALNDAIAACNDALLAIDSISQSPGGPARTLDGDVFAPLTTVRYQNFLSACNTLGAAGLPQLEVRSVDSLMGSLGLINRGQGTMANDIAYWDGIGDTANELARFGPGGISLNHQIIDDSTNFYWRNIDLSESPLVINALAARQNAFFEFEAPLFVPGPLIGGGWSASPPLPSGPGFEVLPYPPLPLGIPYLMGGRGQFVGTASPNAGQQDDCGLLIPLPPLPLPLPPVTLSLDLFMQSVLAIAPNQLAGGIQVSGAAPWANIQFRTAPGNHFMPAIQVLNGAGMPQNVPLPLIDSGWHHLTLQVNPQTSEVLRFTLIDNDTAEGTVIENPGWFVALPGAGAGPAQNLRIACGGQVPANSVVMGFDNVAVAYHVPQCDADLTTTAVPGAPGYGVPNGTLNNDDFFFYLSQFAQGNQAVADVTTTAVPGSPGYGTPNGVINNDDFFYYLTIFAAGC